MSDLVIGKGDLSDPEVIALLTTHLTAARANTAEGSAHALDLTGLAAPEIDFFTLHDAGRLVAVGALKRFDDGTGEVKSMHTRMAERRRGHGATMLRHIVEEARRQGLTRLSLETGSWDYFRPAVALYEAHGFTPCPPFRDYRADPNSLFLTLKL